MDRSKKRPSERDFVEVGVTFCWANRKGGGENRKKKQGQIRILKKIHIKTCRLLFVRSSKLGVFSTDEHQGNETFFVSDIFSIFFWGTNCKINYRPVGQFFSPKRVQFFVVGFGYSFWELAIASKKGQKNHSLRLSEWSFIPLFSIFRSKSLFCQVEIEKMNRNSSNIDFINVQK